MNSLFGSRLYRAFREGYSVEEIASVTLLSPDEIEQRLAAAALCFERQVYCDYRKIGKQPMSSFAGANTPNLQHTTA